MSRKSFFIDSTRCIGCGTCQSVCRAWNDIPSEIRIIKPMCEYTTPDTNNAFHWTRIFFPRYNERTSSQWSLFPQRCNHCTNAPCISACPEKAISKDDHWVRIDLDKCIGCGACEKTCPFKAVTVCERTKGNIKIKKAYKCHACTRTPGNIPACVKGCPTDALMYGDRLRIMKIAMTRLRSVKNQYADAALIGLDEYNGLGVITLVKTRNTQTESTVQNNGSEGVKFVYSLLAPFSMGLPSVKRNIYRITDKIFNSKTV